MIRAGSDGRSGGRGARPGAIPWRLRAAGAGAALALVLAARAAGPADPPVSGFAREVDTLLLVGDAGAPARGEPALAALAAEATKEPGRTLVVFLGDNLYPSGLPGDGDPRRAEGERRLAAQADAALGAGARVLFLPGNHDWDGMGKDGLAAVVRQERFLAARSPRLLYAPGGGCPGPLLLPTRAGVALAVLDTQWWLHHEGPRPEGPASPCAAKDAGQAVAQLRRAAEEGPVVLLSHHPLASGGPHGSRMRDAKAHLFPLRDAHPSLWVPLPLLGSAWVAYRERKGTGQDLASPAYRRLRADLAEAFAGHPALLQASGHDHSLQVLEAPVPEAGWILVSGSGIYPRGRPVSKLPATRWATSRAGFLKVRLARDGPPQVMGLEATADGRAVERFSTEAR